MSAPSQTLRRVAARVLDLLLGLLIAGVALGWVGAQLVPGIASFLALPGGELAFAGLVLPVALALETLWCVALGTTPGKAIMGLRIRRLDGAAPTTRQIVRRQVRLYVLGLAAGLPVLSVITAALQLVRLQRTGATRWDADTSLRVELSPHALRIGAALSITLATLASASVLAATIGVQLLLSWSDRGYRSLAAATANALVSPTAAGAVARTYDRGSWFNAWSGATVRVPAGWQRIAPPRGAPDMAGWGIFQETSDCACKLFVFKADAAGPAVEVPAGSTLAQMLAANWIEAQAGTFALGPLQRLDPAPDMRGWSAQGVRVGQTTERVDVGFLVRSDGVWIMITTWSGDTLQAMSRVDSMRQALLASLD